MTVLRLFPVLLLLAGCSEPERQRITDTGQAFYCRLYPSKCFVPLPPERPAVAQPAPPVAVPVEPAPPRLPAAKATVVAPKATKRKPKRAAETGPDLPYPCWLVRLQADGKSEAELRAMGRTNGITLTPKQERQARACLKKGTKK